MESPSQVSTRISQLESAFKSPQSSPIKTGSMPEPSTDTLTQRPRKTQDDRQVDKEQIGLKCLFEPAKDATKHGCGVAVEYATCLRPTHSGLENNLTIIAS